MKPSALYVRLDMPPIELKVYIKDIADATGMNWHINEEMTIMSNDDESIQYIVGNSIELRVLSYEAERKKWRVIPV